MQEELENQTEATEAAKSAEASVESTEAAAEETPAGESQAAAESAAGETVAEVPSEGEASEEEEGEWTPHRKVRTGVVVSDKMEKSILVKVTRRVRHPLYKKYFYKSKKFMAHDEGNECRVGDTVRISETRPLSARKRWNLDAIIERAK